MPGHPLVLMTRQTLRFSTPADPRRHTGRSLRWSAGRLTSRPWAHALISHWRAAGGKRGHPDRSWPECRVCQPRQKLGPRAVASSSASSGVHPGTNSNVTTGPCSFAVAARRASVPRLGGAIAPVAQTLRPRPEGQEGGPDQGQARTALIPGLSLSASDRHPFDGERLTNMSTKIT